MDDQRFQRFYGQLMSDRRLNVWHISLCLALLHTWQEHGGEHNFPVTRKQLMAMARIRSFMTYHKLLKQLQDFHYISYQPSYHPLEGSRVAFLIRF